LTGDYGARRGINSPFLLFRARYGLGIPPKTESWRSRKSAPCLEVPRVDPARAIRSLRGAWFSTPGDGSLWCGGYSLSEDDVSGVGSLEAPESPSDESPADVSFVPAFDRFEARSVL
jgi:hypothetical protein